VCLLCGLILYFIFLYVVHNKTCMVFSHIFPDIFCCKTWRMVRNGADWLNLVLPWIICIKVYLYTVQGHQLFLWRHGDICFSCFVMMTAVLFREQFCSYCGDLDLMWLNFITLWIIRELHGFPDEWGWCAFGGTFDPIFEFY